MFLHLIQTRTPERYRQHIFIKCRFRNLSLFYRIHFKSMKELISDKKKLTHDPLTKQEQALQRTLRK